jgi:hypothetical protein
MGNPYINKQIWTSIEIVTSYQFDKPFHLYLKDVFRNNKNWGSKDRRNYKNNCYLFLKEFGEFQKFLTSKFESFSQLKELKYTQLIANFNYFLHSSNTNRDELQEIQNQSVEWFKEILSGSIKWNAYEDFANDKTSPINYQKSAESSMDVGIKTAFELNEVNTLNKSLTNKESKTLTPHLSNKIDIQSINKWFKKEAPVFYLDKISGESIEFEPNYPINERVERGDGIIQDQSSTLSIAYLMDWLFLNDFLSIENENRISKIRILLDNYCEDFSVWDCCSGAGGKSIAWTILLNRYSNSSKDLDNHLLCTDIRPQILENLQNRFAVLGIKNPFTYPLDLGKVDFNNLVMDESIFSKFKDAQVVIADLPCSGSGTWRRTPEERLRFEEIESYSDRQYRIIENILRHKNSVDKTYYIYYLTCSVFEQENEGNVQNILKEYPQVECVFENYFGGYEKNADYIYGAFLKVKTTAL